MFKYVRIYKFPHRISQKHSKHQIITQVTTQVTPKTPNYIFEFQHLSSIYIFPKLDIQESCLHYQQFQSFKYDTGTKVLMSKCFRPSNHLSRHAQTFPPGYRNLKDFYNRLRGPRFEKSTKKNRHAWIRSLYIFEPPPM